VLVRDGEQCSIGFHCTVRSLCVACEIGYDMPVAQSSCRSIGDKYRNQELQEFRSCRMRPVVGSRSRAIRRGTSINANKWHMPVHT
jgi:hypothetical protein